jgi:MFS family permease
VASDLSATNNNGRQFHFMLRALAYRNYRLFFFGQGVSLLGTWLTTTATSWLVLRLARGAAHIEPGAAQGLIRFASQIPMFLIAPIAGVLVDRWHRHRVLLVAQTFSMLQSAVLAVLALLHIITIPQVFILNLFQGFVNAFDASARQAFVAEMVERPEDLPNAIALNSSLFNGARFVGPAIAGLIIARFSEGWCFAIDAVSYGAVLIALMVMHVPRVVHTQERRSHLHDLKEGYRYAFGFPPVRTLLMLAATASMTVSAYQTLMPFFADEMAETGHGARLYGILLSAIGAGALSGALYLASRRTVLGLGRIIAACVALVGLAMIAFAAVHTLWLMLPIAVVSGFGMIIAFAASNTVLQAIVDNRMRGRLMSFFVMAMMGTAPIGSLLSGWSRDLFHLRPTIVGAGVLTIAAAVNYYLRLPTLQALVRPIYIKKGIIPEMANGLTAANRLNTAAEE